jgi:hypothetical protein
MQQLNFLDLLTHLDINGAQIAAIVGSIIARMAGVGSELATHNWLMKHSGLGELMEVDYEALPLMTMYRAGRPMPCGNTALGSSRPYLCALRICLVFRPPSPYTILPTWHLLAKPLLYRIINHIGFFGGCLKRLNRLVSKLFMEFTPIQVFPVHRIIEHILTHRTLQASHEQTCQWILSAATTRALS